MGIHLLIQGAMRVRPTDKGHSSLEREWAGVVRKSHLGRFGDRGRPPGRGTVQVVRNGSGTGREMGVPGATMSLPGASISCIVSLANSEQPGRGSVQIC